MHRTSHRAGVYRTIIIVRLVRIGYVEQSRQNDRCFGMLLAVISLSLSHGHMLRWLSLKSVLSARHLVGSRKTHVFLNIVRKHWSTKAVDFGTTRKRLCHFLPSLTPYLPHFRYRSHLRLEILETNYTALAHIFHYDMADLSLSAQNRIAYAN